MAKKQQEYSFTAYDDAFRILETECDDALIQFVNYVFHENYDKTAKIIRLRNEHFVEKQGEVDEKRITDAHFSVMFQGEKREYHIECESQGYSDTILVRIFQYAVQTAIDSEKEVDHYRITVRLPHSMLLVLKNDGKPPKEITLEIVTPGGNVAYKVPVISEADFGIEELFDKKLYFLIPFYFFNHEKQMDEYETDPKALKRFEQIYYDILERIRETEEGNLSLRSKGVIIKQMACVSKRLADKREKVREKVGEIMSNDMADTLAWLERFDSAVADGKAVGRAEGRAEGKADLLVSLICRKLRKGKTVEQIADELEEDEVRIQVICDAAEAFAPDYDEERVIQAVGIGNLV